MTKKRFCKLSRAFLSRAGIMTKAVDRKLSDYKVGPPASSYADLWDAISKPNNLGIGVKENHQ